MISLPLQTQLNLDLVQDYQNTQTYVTTLFDTLPKIQLSSTSDKGTTLIKKLVSQNQEYGKKIIELSEKFTSFYRKDHIFDKKDLQQKIQLIYQILIDQQIPPSLQVDQMLSLILKKIKSDSYNIIKAGYQHLQESQGRNTQIQNIMANRMAESKIQLKNISQSNMKQSKFVVPNQNLYLEGLNPNGQNLAQSVAVSRKQSIQSKNKSVARSTTKKRQKNILQDEQIPLKKILKINALMEEEEIAIKSMFSKITVMLDELKVSKLNLSQQRLTYTKIQDERNQENLEQLLQASTTNHKSNLHKISQLLEIVFSDFQKKIVQEMQSQNQFALYTKEIEKREEVYSYAVSKLIGHLNNLKSNLSQQNHRESMGIVQDLIGIGTKFYELYPSNSIIKDLKVRQQKKEFQQQNQCNYGVQVNTIKSSNPASSNMKNSSSTYSESNRQTSQYQLEMFKFETKVTELFDKFQKGQLKFKKSIDVKEVHKLLNSIKQLVPQRSKTTLSSHQLQDLTKFQSEYRQLLTQYQEKQQKLTEQNHKKQKKLQKLNKQLQNKLQHLQILKSQQLNQAQEQIKKINKKLQTTHQKYKLSQKKNQDSQKIVKLVQEEIELIKQKYREEQLRFQHQFQIQQQKLALLSQQTSQKQSQLHSISSKQEQKQSQFESEILLYKKKIVLLEDKNQSLIKENQHLKNRLESVTASAELSKQNLSQMTEVYESKIKQVDQMIESIEELRHELDKKNDKISEMEEQNQKLNSISSHLEVELDKQLQITNRLKEDIENERKQKEKIQQTGQLNESDVQKLKSQMTKVHSAYIESEQELQNLRQLYEQLQNQTNKLQQQNNTLTLKNSQLNSKLQQTTLTLVKYKNLEKNNEHLLETNNTLQSENQQLSIKFKELQNELYLIKKQSKKIKQQELDHSKELRQLRQELQRHKEEESLIKGKSKIELQSLKIELRKKTEENSKIKEMYEQKLDMLSGKYKELQKFVSQKELLAKISNNHSTQ